MDQESMRGSAAGGASAQEGTRAGGEGATREREQRIGTAREGVEPGGQGVAAENARLGRRLLDLWNARDFDQLTRVIADNCECISVPTKETFRGPQGYREFMQHWATAFPDGRVEVTRVIADQNGAVVEYTGRGTQTGPLTGPMGTIPPTGRHGELALCDVLEIEQGKVRRARSYFDVATLMRQLGIMPEQGTAGVSGSGMHGR
jgi:steroid delta-isomerase-like uncharacterized protein